MEALPLLQSVVRRRPEDGPANLLLGQVLIQVGRTQNALEPLHRALAAERWAVPAGLLLASAYLSEGRAEAALEAVNRVLETHPGQTGALRIRATAHLQLGEAEAALTDARRILELDPADPQAPVLASTALTRLGRLDEAEATLVTLEQLAREADAPSRHASACAALATFLESVRQDRDRAGALWDGCLERHPADVGLLQGATAHFDQHGRRDLSMAALERALEHEPSALGIRLALARRLAAEGRHEEGDRLLVEAAEQRGAEAVGGSAGAVAAWQAVATYRQHRGDLEGSDTAFERAIAVAPREHPLDLLRYQRAAVLIDRGRSEEAASIGESIEAAWLRDLLAGRIAFAEGRFDPALAAFARSIEREPGHARAHYWLGVAAQSLGRIDRAFQAFGRALELEPDATDAALAAAQLAAALGDHGRALELVRHHRSARGTLEGRAQILEARALLALGESRAAEAVLEERLRRAHDAEALALLADRIARREGAAAALARIERARESGLDLTDPAHGMALGAFAAQAVAAGRAGAALELLREARTRSPEWLEPHRLEASVRAASGDVEAAEATLQELVKQRPDDPDALALLAGWLHGRGRSEAARALVERAREAAPDDAEIAYLAARVWTALDRSERAEAALRATVTANPLHVSASNDLAWLLAAEGRDLDLALRLARRAARLSSGGAALDTLGWVQLARGEPEAAVGSLAEAVARAPDQPGYRYRLGLALARTGRAEEARTAFEHALEHDPFPEAPEAREALARLDR